VGLLGLVGLLELLLLQLGHFELLVCRERVGVVGVGLLLRHVPEVWAVGAGWLLAQLVLERHALIVIAIVNVTAVVVIVVSFLRVWVRFLNFIFGKLVFGILD
jgi:hypothetical protein